MPSTLGWAVQGKEGEERSNAEVSGDNGESDNADEAEDEEADLGED